MAKTLVFLEHHEGSIAKGSLGVLAKAAQIGGDVAAVLIGADVRGLAERAGAFGAGTVWVADDASLAAPLPQPRVDVLAKLVADAASTRCSSRSRCSPPTLRRDSRRDSTPG